jgi:hypothetical protein
MIIHNDSVLNEFAPARDRRPSARLRNLISHQILPIEASCGGCGRHGLIEPWALIDRLSSDYPIRDVAKYCRCSRCGSQDAETRPGWIAAPPPATAVYEGSPTASVGGGQQQARSENTADARHRDQ